MVTRSSLVANHLLRFLARCVVTTTVSGILLSLSLSAQEPSFGTRVVKQRGLRAVVDDRPSAIEVAVKDWVEWEKPAEPVIFPTYRRWQFRDWKVAPSVGLLLTSAKRFDDDLVATLQLMALRKTGPQPGLDSLLNLLAQSLLRAGQGDPQALAEALARVHAAQKLGGVTPQWTDRQRERAERLLAEFETDPSRHPIGIYSRSTALSALFRQRRFLQQGFKIGSPEGAWLLPIHAALQANPAVATGYRTLTELTRVLSGESTHRTLLELEGNRDQFAAFLPVSWTLEDHLLRKLYGSRPIPEGRVFMDDFVAATRNGTLGLNASAPVGWYSRKVWALEPLVRIAAAAEQQKVRRHPSYTLHCEEAFRAALTGRRETHSADLAGHIYGAIPKITISPRITIEPQVTLYSRVADSYQALRRDLVSLLGENSLALEKMNTEEGPSSRSVHDGLIAMERRFQRIAALSCHEIGGKPEWVGAGVNDESARLLAQDARSAGDDKVSASDLDMDPRVMVPIGINQITQKTRCWVVVGIALRDLEVWYAVNPAVVVFDEKTGERLDESKVRVDYFRNVLRTPYEVAIECEVPKPLTREELRALCDKCMTLTEIKAALSALK